MAQPNELKRRLREVIEHLEESTGAQWPVLTIANLIDIPQPTLWRILYGRRGADVIEARNIARLRVLLHDLDEQTWQSLLYSPENRVALSAYERAVTRELAAHQAAYGLANDDWIGLPLSAAAERKIKALCERLTRRGHHPGRVLLANWRVRAPFILGRFCGHAEQVTGEEELRLVSLGIKREEILLRRPPSMLQPLGMSGPPPKPGSGESSAIPAPSQRFLARRDELG